MHSRNKGILPNSYTSTRQELYPNSQKMMPSTNASNKYKMRRDNLNKLIVLSRVIVQYSYWPQMTLTHYVAKRKSEGLIWGGRGV
jgi:hypothetical protein